MSFITWYIFFGSRWTQTQIIQMEAGKESNNLYVLTNNDVTADLSTRDSVMILHRRTHLSLQLLVPPSPPQTVDTSRLSYGNKPKQTPRETTSRFLQASFAVDNNKPCLWRLKALFSAKM